jgi:hypothetical protein
VRELKERDTQTDESVREVTKRSLESGAPDDAIIVDNLCKKARVSNARPFKIVRTRDELDMQWARGAVSAGLPMSFFDNKEVRKAVRMTAECGESYIRTKPGGVKDTTLPHRTYFTTKLIPKLDKFIDGPIVNIIMGVRSLHTLRASIDTMGEEKTMDFIAALITPRVSVYFFLIFGLQHYFYFYLPHSFFLHLILRSSAEKYHTFFIEPRVFFVETFLFFKVYQ